MTAEEAIRAYCTSFPTWAKVEDALSVQPRGGWQYILFHSEIGRVKLEGNKIIVETFVSQD